MAKQGVLDAVAAVAREHVMDRDAEVVYSVALYRNDRAIEIPDVAQGELMSDLDGKVAIVTGSTKGIGAQMASRFADVGARVVVTGRTEEAGEAVAKSILSSGGEAIFVRADLANEADVAQLVDRAVAAYGTVDILVNNAAATDTVASGHDGAAADTEAEDFEYQLRVSLVGPFLCAKAVLPIMVAGGGGSIVNISSVAGAMGLRSSAAYSAAKGGLASLTRSVAVDYGRANVRCNTIVLGFVVSSDVARQMLAIPRCRELLTEGSLLPGVGEMDDIAEAAIFFASDRAKFVTGASLAVDGGVSINGRLPDLSDMVAAAFS